MNLDFSFFLNSILLGVGLAMDAFSVSLANGLHEPCMKKSRVTFMAAVFAGFQFLMPLVGWVCVTTIAQHFKVFEQFIPWIALMLLSWIGAKMLIEGFHEGEEDCGCHERTANAGLSALLVQGVATSIVALSVGFTIADHNLTEALLACLMIGAVTFFICYGGILIGKKAGTKLAGKAGIFGGVILIIIGLEIFITNVF